MIALGIVEMFGLAALAGWFEDTEDRDGLKICCTESNNCASFSNVDECNLLDYIESLGMFR